MPFPIIDPSVNEYYNPITKATYMRGPNNVWIQVDQFNKVDVDVLKDAFDAEYVNLTGDQMTGPLILSHAGDGVNLFEMLGRKPGSADDVVDERVFWYHHNAGTVGDAVNYAGRIENNDNLVNKKYVDDAITNAGSIAGFLKKDGDTMSGTITFDGTGSRISAGTVTNLTDRCTLLLTTAGNLPVGIASGSETSKILSLYRYNNTEDDNREEIATFQANGYTRLGGKLRIQPKLLADGDVAFEIKDDTDARIYMRKNGNAALKSTATSGLVFGIAPAGLDPTNASFAFSVEANGAVRAGQDTLNPWMAVQANDVVTKGYLDSASLPYLPTGGGTLTGNLNTNSLIKSTRDGGGAFEIKPNNTTQRAVWNTSGRIDITMESASNAAIRTIGSINVKKSGEDIGGANIFLAGKDYVRYYGPISNNDDIATKKYVDDKSGGAGGVVLHGTSSPPSGQARGTLLMTTDNKFYIYV